VPPSDDVPFGAFDIWLPIRNRDSTPACAVEIAAKWVAKDKDLYEDEHGKASTQGAVIVPGDTLHFAIGRVNLSGPHTVIEVDAETRYRTADTSAGRLTVGFIYDQKGWRNRPGPTYEFALTDGSRHPEEDEKKLRFRLKFLSRRC
jgi:hypothetical protein